jgi:hypothetical protein
MIARQLFDASWVFTFFLWFLVFIFSFATRK